MWGVPIRRDVATGPMFAKFNFAPYEIFVSEGESHRVERISISPMKFTFANARPSVARSLVTLPLLWTALAAGCLGGCGVFKSLRGQNSVDIKDAELKTMKVDIRNEAKTICPREPVQMAVFASLLFKGDKAPKDLETYVGGEKANKNGKLEFTEFAFQSTQGQVDEYGVFTPAADLRATIGSPYEIKTTFRRQPDKFSVDSSYKPDYGCIKSTGTGGAGGEKGSPGSSGMPGRSGSYGGSTQPGGRGTDGQAGGPGGQGGDGRPGPHIQAYATMVKTPFYDKLIAVEITGDVHDFLLAPADRPLVLTAAGGAGGSGGDGGNGGDGANGGAGAPNGDGGNGGPGGVGGNAGRGGAGGTIELVVDAHFSELASLVQLDVRGGAPGGAGSAGSGGRAGEGAMGTGQQGRHGAQGPDGTPGAPGGQAGTPGRASAHAGAVDTHFKDIAGLTILGSAQNAAVAQDAMPADAPPATTKGRKASKSAAKGK